MNSTEVAILHAVSEIDQVVSSVSELQKKANYLLSSVTENDGVKAVGYLNDIKKHAADLQSQLRVLDRQIESLEKYGYRI